MRTPSPPFSGRIIPWIGERPHVLIGQIYITSALRNFVSGKTIYSSLRVVASCRTRHVCYFDGRRLIVFTAALKKASERETAVAGSTMKVKETQRSLVRCWSCLSLLLALPLLLDHDMT